MTSPPAPSTAPLPASPPAALAPPQVDVAGAAAAEYDRLGRHALSAEMRGLITDAFASIPARKRSALVIVHDFDSGTTRAHVAARINSEWKIAGGPGFDWTGRKPTGWVGIEWSK